MQDHFYDEYVAIEPNHWWFRARSKILPSLIAPYVSSPAKVLDVGSGGGQVTQAFLSLGQVTACDVDIRCGTAVQRRPGVQFVSGTAEALPFPNGSFDLVTAFDVLEHVDDDQLVLGEMRRVLAEGGVIAVTVPAFSWLWGRQDEVSNHRRRYSAKLLRDNIMAAGFTVQRLTFFNSFLFPFVAGVRISRRLVPIGSGATNGKLPSDFSLTRPGRVNDVLEMVFSAERFYLRHLNFPFGVSLLAVARVGPQLRD